MIFCEYDYPKIFDQILLYLEAKDVELVFVSNLEMREINLAQRGIDKTTDVLSFPFVFTPHSLQGSIVINTELADEVAKKFGHSYEDELCLMFVHGVLHILGYDHENDNGQMRQKEREITTKFNLPDSLIVRVEEL